MDKLNHIKNATGNDRCSPAGTDKAHIDDRDIPCDLIIDLLPLYADGTASSAANRMVEEHIRSCPECSEKLRMMKDDDHLRNAAPPAVPDDDIDYMKKSRRATILIGSLIMVFFIVFAGIMLILDIRHENDQMYNEMNYPGVSTNLYWDDEKVTYKGDEYTFVDLSASEDDTFDIISPCPVDEEQSTPEFTVSDKVSSWDRFLKKTHTLNMFRVKSGTGLPFFYNSRYDDFLCRTSDMEKIEKYYLDTNNYGFSTRQWSEREDANGDYQSKTRSLKLTDEEKRFLSDMNDDMADTELRDDLPEICLCKTSLDGLYSTDIKLLLKDGHWYYEYCTSDREQEDFEDENVTYVMCIRMPDSLNDKLNKNYIRGW